MPRAGSTLLQNIVFQNHQFYATNTSGLAHILKDLVASFSNTIEFRNDYTFDTWIKPAFLNFCREGIYGWWKSRTNKPYVLDKSRIWIHDVPFLNELFPNPKIIILVRDLRNVLASYEKMYINDFTQKYFTFNDKTSIRNITVDNRYDYYLNDTTLNLFLIHLYNIIHSPYKNKLYIMKYEDLVENPKNELEKMYKYLEVPYYEKHQFNRVVQHTKENDNYNLFGDHKIHSKVQKIPSNLSKLMPKHISDKIYKEYDWFFKEFNYSK